MKYRYYKNGNIHVRFDSDIDLVEGDYSYADMICIIYNSMLDCIDYENFDSYFSTIAIINQANGITYDYVIPYEDMDKFFSGKCVVLRGVYEHAYVKIPRYYAHGTYTDANNQKFVYYKLEDVPTDDFMNEMQYHGCFFNYVAPRYAPEMKRITMFVPYGTHIEFL